MKAIELLIDSARGNFIPQHFAESCVDWVGSRSATWSITAEDHRRLGMGPGLDEKESEDYWDTWADVLDSSKFVTPEGRVYTLHQGESGDVFAVCEALMTPKERMDFLGMEPEDAGLKPYTVVGYYPDNGQSWVGQEWALNAEDAINQSPDSVTTLAAFKGHHDEAED